MIERFKNPIFVTQPTLPNITEFKTMIDEIWETKRLTNGGPKLICFEKNVSDYLKTPNVNAVVNGHSALEISIRALELTGEVITTPFTFPSTVHALCLNNLQPVFCDVDPKTFNLSPQMVERHITSQTSAIMAVHVYGNPCDVVHLSEIAKKYNLKIIYDAAHAFGAEIDGKGIGQFGDMSAFSLHATKVFNSIEGGLVTYLDPKYGERIRQLRNFGYDETSGDEDVITIGSNMKMSELHAAIGLLNLLTVDEHINRRKGIYAYYLERINQIKGLSIITPYASKPNFAYCPVVVDSKIFSIPRDQIITELAKYNVFARKYFYPLCNELSCYRNTPFLNSHTPVAKGISDNVICLPIFPELSLKSVNKICKIIESLTK